MTLPLGWVEPFWATVCGALFGFVLQRAGLGNGCRLTAQLRMQDWTVFNVMFTAILVAAIGLYILELGGWMQPAGLFVPTAYLWATLAGGALVGVGMGLGGYCPGTAVVGATAGRLDGIVFFAGLIVGVLVFAGVYDRVAAFMTAAAQPEGQTLPQLLHLPTWVVLLLLITVAAAVGWLTRRVRPSALITCAD